MVVDSLPSDSDEVRWEFRYESNELEREEAAASFRRISPRNRTYRFGYAVGLVLAVAFWPIVWWISAWAGKLSERLLPDSYSQDFRWSLSVASSILVILAIFLLLRYLYLVRLKTKKNKLIQGLVRIYINKDVSFVDADQISRRHIEGVKFNSDYLFVMIEEGKRFVYLPRRVVDSVQFDALVEFIN